MKLRRAILYTLLIAALSLTVSCGSSKKASSDSTASRKSIFELYNKVQLEQTKDQIDKALAVSPEKNTQVDNIYEYVSSETGFGVSVMFNKNNKATGKTVIYNSHSDIAPFCKAVTKKQSEKIKKGMTNKQVKKILGGEGIEICRSIIEFDGGKVSVTRRWANSDNSCLDVCFGTNGTVLDSSYSVSND